MRSRFLVRFCTSRALPLAGPLLVVLLAGITVFSGCSKRVTVPPITSQPTGTYHTGKFVWMDLVTSDVRTAREFYGKLFGWQFEGDEGRDVPFTQIKQGGVPIGGLVYSDKMDPSQPQARWLAYISVPDVDKAAETVRQNGGEIFVAPFDLPQRGRVAIVLDPQKVPFGLLKASGGDPPDEKVTPFRWMWYELWTTDTAGVMPFYRQLAGYNTVSATSSVQREAYTVLMSGGTACAGMAPIVREGVKPIWLPYVNVDDPGSIAAKTLTLGGKVLIAPDSSIRNGTVGVIADPTGGVVAIQKWTPQDKLNK